mmetsp:Transcript_22970/g.32134  ORF Transcript_22970/g.32134 Transcript_22970/m.32134 type:complete len:239 (+) Transcript_22970:56-772(+)|eukprot:CAMPEP_0185270726 /NCGR_PEP_ID=MMETSP1359-20130426/43016_1 /TAXON_ID=552665 /ORGANISM="Bigelowiella longifila, Strain CCMP242" /LENGTH=238 /DNA_ID=CAMNT_0027862413 /DNA_START=36 /DNA_END=752 /DNA_ORIENTATION=+
MAASAFGAGGSRVHRARSKESTPVFRTAIGLWMLLVISVVLSTVASLPSPLSLGLEMRSISSAPASWTTYKQPATTSFNKRLLKLTRCADHLTTVLARSVGRSDGRATAFKLNVADEDVDLMRNQLIESEPKITGEMIMTLLMAKYGRAYDIRLCKRRDAFGQSKVYLQIMWKFLGQRGFMSKENYLAQLDSVAAKVNEWGCATDVLDGIEKCKQRPKVDTAGANAIMIPLNIDTEVL